MREALIPAVALLVAASVGTAQASEQLACWFESRVDQFGGDPVSVTVCVVEGSTDEFVLSEGTATDFDPDVGYDLSGTQCWFWTTRSTEWVILSIVGNTATLGWDPGGGPGGPVAIDVTLPGCSSRPTPALSDAAAVWSLIEEYVHQRPDPILDPPVGLGLTGLETFVAVTPPEPFDGSLLSPGTGVLLEVHAEVSAVTVAWGDGSDVDSFPPALYEFLTVSPDGIASHVYEVKTCSPPGGERCHPDLEAYPLVVSYEWTARWRPGSSDWRVIEVPPTATTVDYPLDEVIATITEGD